MAAHLNSEAGVYRLSMALLARKYARIFRRHGGGKAGNLRLYSELPQTTLAALKERCSIGEDEVPIIASLSDSSSWFLLTTKRIAWANPAGAVDLPLGEISDATVDSEGLSRAKSKKDLRDLKLISIGGARYNIAFSSEADFFPIWNLLKAVAADNRRAKLCFLPTAPVTW